VRCLNAYVDPAKITWPDGSALNYTYDTAHRLVAVADAKGNRVDYTLDAAGNRIREDLKDSGGVLKRQLRRSVDALGRVQQVSGR
jgi:YD repeat-containing protein